jgi:O-antigen ligase
MLSGRLFVRILSYCLAAIVLIGILIAVALPDIGRHVAGDSLSWSALHAGRWRGSFWHKNAFGPMAALCFSVWLIGGREIAQSLYLRSTVLAASVLATWMSGSAQAVFQVLLALLFVGYYKAGRRDLRALLASILTTIVAAWLLWSNPVTFVMDALGRESDLSGRTVIWEIVVTQGNFNPLIGGGYGAGFLGGLDEVFEDVMFQKITNAHNGFLQQYVELGYIGLVLVFAAWARYFQLLSSRSITSWRVQTYAFFPAFYFTTNLVDNYFMRSQDIYWFLFCAFMVLLARETPSKRIAAKMIKRRWRKPALT